MKTVFINGSPKKKLSVSSYLLGIVRLFVRGEVVSEQVRNKGDYKRVLKSIEDAKNVVLFLSLGAFFYCLRMGRAVNKGATLGVKFTRVLLPSFLFILAADIFFVIISVFQGGIFRGWLKQK